MSQGIVWGWQPALYLFLGGMGAGAFLIAGVLWFRYRDMSSRLLVAAMGSAFGCVAIGLLLLLSELITPWRALLMWQSFGNFASWMAIGAWLAFAAMIVFALSAILIAARAHKGSDALASPSSSRTGISALVAVGMVLAFGVAVYTGMLLMAAPGIPLWDTFLLPCLFTVSAIDTGVALVEILGMAFKRRWQLREDEQLFLDRCVVVLLALEILCIIAFFAVSLSSASPAAKASALALVIGNFAVAFWLLFIAIGIVMPLVAALWALSQSKRPKNVAVAADGSPAGRHGAVAARDIAPVAITGAVGVLIGGCALRFLILWAGTHGDLITATLTQLNL